MLKLKNQLSSSENCVYDNAQYIVCLSVVKVADNTDVMICDLPEGVSFEKYEHLA